jgi:hypothetical protein
MKERKRKVIKDKKIKDREFDQETDVTGGASRKRTRVTVQDGYRRGLQWQRGTDTVWYGKRLIADSNL